MKANEIRIGNLLAHTNENGTFNIVVKEILESGINTHFNNGTWFIGLDNIHPIPLTEEILLKAGFEKESFGFYLYKDFIVRKIRQADNHWRFIFKHRDIKDIEHLHDLQNLIFALTGEEIKIEL